MKKIIFALCSLVLLLSLSGCNQSSSVDTTPESTLITQIKKVNQETSCEEILELHYDPSGNLLSYRGPDRVIFYAYDENGNRLSRREFYPNGKQAGETTFYYSNDGLLLSTEGWDYSDWDLKAYEKTEYQYDTGGNLLGIKKYSNGELSMEQSFDVQGNLLEQRSYQGGKYDVIQTYTYNNNGIVLTEHIKIGGKDHGGADYIYSAEGLLLYKDSYIFEGTDRKESRATYHYDKSGNLLQWHISNYQGGPSIYTYTYDINGNRLSETYSSPTHSHCFQWTYDITGRKLTETQIFNHESREYAWEHDSHGNVIYYEEGTADLKTAYSFSYRFASVDPADADESKHFIDSFTYSLNPL